MKTPIQRYDGLFGDLKASASSEFLQCESLEIRSRAFDWEISEHFHSDLYQLFIFRAGGGTYTLGKVTRKVRPGTVLFIPANTLHGFHFDESVQGEVITMSARIIENMFRSRPAILQQLQAKAESDFTTQTDSFTRILSYYAFLMDEHPQQKKEKWAVQRSLLELILTELYRSGEEAERQLLLTSHRSLGHYQQFVNTIKRTMDQSQTVANYASNMGITVVHLNRICREVVGKSALEVIHELIIQEAKNYLLNTQYGIAEIAYFLNFNDPAYFNRLFRKKVGVPPGEFRRV